MYRVALLAVAFAIAVGVADTVLAVDPHVQSGLNYLTTTQNADGSWGGTPASLTTVLHTTSSVVDTLRDLSQTGTPSFTQASGFLGTQNPELTDSIGRKVITLSGLGVDLSADVSTLLARQNADGGWGANAGFSTDVLDTALAVRGLFAAGFPRGLLVRGKTVTSGPSDAFMVEVPAGSTELTIVVTDLSGTIDLRIKQGTAPGLGDPFFHLPAAPALIDLTPSSFPMLQPGTNFIRIDTASSATYSLELSVVAPSGDGLITLNGLKNLLDGQNTDGGWGLVGGDTDSRVFYSAEVADALLGVSDVSSVLGFLTAHHHSDGGFGDAMTSSAFETGLATRILLLAGADIFALAPSPASFLRSTQSANGSWDDDPYSTALAVRALAPAAEAMPSIDVGTGVGRPGGIACVPATLSSGLAQVVATSNQLGFDAAQLTFNNCTINPSIGAGSTANKSLTATFLSPGAASVQIGGNANVLADGLLYTCRFAIGSAAAVGSHPLTNGPGATDAAGTPIADVGGAAGQILVTTCTGDCNGDGHVTIGEVIKCVNLFLGFPFCNPTNPSLSCPVADVNSNGIVSIGDVTQCVNRFLTGCA